MSEEETVEPPSKWKLAAYVAVAILIALSWLSLAIVLDVDPRGFAISSDGSQTTELDEPVEDVTVEELRGTLMRTNQGGGSSVSMSAIWATETYVKASGLGTDAYDTNQDENHVFLIFLNTHTDTIPELDWESDATLEVNGKTIDAANGRMVAGGYHHGTAVVEFPREIDGEPTLTDDIENVTLSVVGLEKFENSIPADRPRRISWEYPPPYYDTDPGAFKNSEA